MAERIFLDENPFWCSDADIENKNINPFDYKKEIQQQQDLFQQFFKKESHQCPFKQSQNSHNSRLQEETTQDKPILSQFNKIQKKLVKEEEYELRQLRKQRKYTAKKAVYVYAQQDYESQKADSQSVFIPNTNLKNSSQTKNIPKNFGRAIISFILGNQKIIENVMVGQDKKMMLEFREKLLKFKKNIKTIQGIRQMWIGEKNAFSKQMRVLSQLFLRKHCLSYIFNSRIKNHALNIKYRGIIMRSLRHPQKFTSLKQF